MRGAILVFLVLVTCQLYYTNGKPHWHSHHHNLSASPTDQTETVREPWHSWHNRHREWGRHHHAPGDWRRHHHSPSEQGEERHEHHYRPEDWSQRHHHGWHRGWRGHHGGCGHHSRDDVPIPFPTSGPIPGPLPLPITTPRPSTPSTTVRIYTKPPTTTPRPTSPSPRPEYFPDQNPFPGQGPLPELRPVPTTVRTLTTTRDTEKMEPDYGLDTELNMRFGSEEATTKASLIFHTSYA